MKRLLPALLLMLTACLPGVTHHPRPNPSLNIFPFADLSCTPDAYGRWTCPSDSKPAALECAELREADPLLGGLRPATPLAVCVYAPPDVYAGGFPGPDDYFYNRGGLMPRFVRYLIAQNGEVRLLKGMPDLRATFAPVESPEEALAFVLASAPVEARYDVQPVPGYRYEVLELEDTYVQSVNGGYLVYVYAYQLFGCGPHYTEGVLYKVTADGYLEVVARRNLFRDPEQDGLCVD